jgi:putative peptide zinc metalloprotease protein
VETARDISIRDFGGQKLKLRSDLVFTPRTLGGEPCYTIEDVVNSKFYRVGIPEYTFISLLDGATTVRQALSLAARANPQSAMTEPEATVICQWLVDTELASTSESSRPARLIETANRNANARILKKWNPTVIRFPLLYPDHFFELVSPWVSWLYAPAAVAAWSVLIGAAAYRIGSQWERFSEFSRGVLAPNNWLWLVLCWILLKFLHEFSHGAVCKRYGGTVRETGLMFIMLAPVAYVDVTSSWRFRSKWQRIHTAAAGVYMELLCAAIAALVWSHTEPGPLNLVCFNAVLMASLTTLLFNANPLMKYDGYYILSDLLDIPNLYSNGQQYLQHWALRYLLGVSSSPPRCSGPRRLAIRCYGIASLAWRIVFSVAIVLAAATFFHGAGILLSCIAGILWLGLPAIRFAKYLSVGTEVAQPHRVRFFCITGAALALLSIVLAIPWPGSTRAPAVVEYSPLLAVRAGASGFVRNVLAQPGAYVEEGQVLALLENPELCSNLQDLALAQQQSQISLRSLEKKGQLAAYQAELENLKALEKRHAETLSQVEQLTVRAPCRGIIIGRNLEAWLGRYAKAGSELVWIGDESTLELRLSIGQRDIEAFKGRLDHEVRVRLPHFRSFSCLLVRVNPSASVDLPYAALAAPNGGPLAVREKDRIDRNKTSEAEKYELLSPRFTGFLTPDLSRSQSLRAGQQGVAIIRPYNESIGGHLYRILFHWTEQKLATSRSS